MKHGYRWMFALVLLHLAVTGVLLTFAPAEVPLHYNLQGEVDRIGSKYEYLLLPGVSALMALFFFALARSKRRSAQERKVLQLTACLITLLFTGLTVFFVLQAMRQDALPLSRGSGKIAVIFLGLVICVLSNFMPKVRRNGLFGLRTSWSMRSDAVWQRSQRFGGISGVICGAAMVLCGCVLPNTAASISALVLLLLWCVLGVVASWRYARQEQQAEANKKEPF